MPSNIILKQFSLFSDNKQYNKCSLRHLSNYSDPCHRHEISSREVQTYPLRCPTRPNRKAGTSLADESPKR